MEFSFRDFLSIVEIAILLFASSFALYLPLAVFLKSFKGALKTAIPISISVQIIIGYIFYSLGKVQFYGVVYLFIIITANILAVISLRDKFAHIKLPKIKPLSFILAAATVLILIYTRFYDSVSNIAPGTIDTFNHLEFIKELAKLGRLTNAYYAPGFHLFLYPLTYLVKYSEIYRFAGGIIGMIFAFYAYLLLKDNFKNKITYLFLGLLLALPLFKELTLSTIGFYPSSLSFIIFLGFIYFLTLPEEIGRGKNLLLYLILNMALAVTVPYLFVQYLPALFVVLIAVLVQKSLFGAKAKKTYFYFFLISCFGLALAFGHTYLQTKIIRRANAFPEIPIAAPDTAEISTNQENVKKISEKLSFLKDNSFSQNYIFPFLASAEETLSIKNIRGVNNYLSIGAYLWFAATIVLLYFSIKLKNKYLFIVSCLSVVFGISILIGIFEMSFYRGRAGWYLLVLAIIGIAIIFDKIYSSKLVLFWAIIFAFMALSAILYPPKYYRAYYSDTFEQVSQIAKNYPDEKICLITSQYQLSILSDNIITLPLTLNSFDKAGGKRFLIIEKKYFRPNPVLSQQALSVDKDFKLFNQKQDSLERDFNDRVKQITTSSQFSPYKLFWENDNIWIYSSREQK